jgi:hypothetical protein
MYIRKSSNIYNQTSYVITAVQLLGDTKCISSLALLTFSVRVFFFFPLFFFTTVYSNSFWFCFVKGFFFFFFVILFHFFVCPPFCKDAEADERRSNRFLRRRNPWNSFKTTTNSSKSITYKKSLLISYTFKCLILIPSDGWADENRMCVYKSVVRGDPDRHLAKD